MIQKLVNRLKLAKALRSLKRKLSVKLYTTLLWLGVRPTEIYTLVTLSFKEDWGSSRSRLWSWHATREEAMQCAERSADFFSECGYYTHIVIEKVSYRSLPYDHYPVWYELRALKEPIMEEYEMEDGSKGVYQHDYEAVRVEAPPQSRNLIGWGIG